MVKYKQAIIILMHKNVSDVLNLIAKFDDCFEFYIHIDKKTHCRPEELKKLLLNKKIRLLCQKYDIRWGGYNILRTTLFLAEKAIQDPAVKYVHVISGADYPLKSFTYFKLLFQANCHQYIEIFPLPTRRWNGGGINRIIYYNLYDYINIRSLFWNKIHNKFLNFQKAIHIKRPLPKMFASLYGGGNWWSLSKNCLQYVIDYTKKNPQFLKRLRFTFAPEEIYFQTIIMHSDFAGHIINDHLRYIKWEFRNNNYPANLDMTDLKPILLSNKLFGRKIESPVSLPLVKKLEYIQKNALSIPPKAGQLSILYQIAEYLVVQGEKSFFNGLYYGKVGAALFLFQYSLFSQQIKYAGSAITLIENVRQELEHSFNLNYEEGLLGWAVCIEYLYCHHFIEDDTNEILEDIDIVVLSWLKRTDNLQNLVFSPIYRLDTYINYRRLNPQNKNKKLFQDYYSRVIMPVSAVLQTGFKTDLDYIQQIHSTYLPGIKDGYAGIGLAILAELIPDIHSHWIYLI